ncbi:hypothetical protein ACFYY8_23075 [Streptosporangium sp. NPDC001559]|uniref:hypothetical protein n=1 Tax=Streptosporangium sp. NPDC001559 TaxID=3366187 RepID=UPI0036F00503
MNHRSAAAATRSGTTPAGSGTGAAALRIGWGRASPSSWNADRRRSAPAAAW